MHGPRSRSGAERRPPACLVPQRTEAPNDHFRNRRSQWGGPPGLPTRRRRARWRRRFRRRRSRPMIILGIGGLGGDAAAAILKDGELAAAVEESKLVRRRTQWVGREQMPDRAIATCLDLAGTDPTKVDTVAI